MKNNLIASILLSCSAYWGACQTTEKEPAAFDDTVTPVPAFNYAPSRVMTYEWRNNAWSPDEMSEYTYGAGGRLDQWRTYDFQGDPSLPFDPASDAGWVLQYQHQVDYDTERRPIYWDSRVGDSLDAIEESFTYEYDGDHRQLSRMMRGSSSDEAIYYYDEFRRLERIEGHPNQFINSSSLYEKQISTFEYDTEGRLISANVVNRLRQPEADTDTTAPPSEPFPDEPALIAQYFYDDQGQIEQIEIDNWMNSETEDPLHFVFTYSWLDGRIWQITDAGQIIEFEYDAQGLLLSKEQFLLYNDVSKTPMRRLEFLWADEGNSGAIESAGGIPSYNGMEMWFGTYGSGTAEIFSSFSNELLMVYGQGEPNRYLRVE